MLANKKVYVGKFLKEILEKTSKLNFEILNNDFIRKYPFILFHSDKTFTQIYDIEAFNNCCYEEVSPEWILALEEPKPKKTLADLMPISGFYVDREGEIQELKDHTQHYTTELWNVLPSKKEAEAYKILPMLLHFRDRYNEGWAPNWKDMENFSIGVDDCGNIELRTDTRSVLTFKTKEILYNFLNDFREELEIVKPLL